MMSDASSIDNTTVDELTGKLVLLIEEDRGWHEASLMHRQLAAKVKSYVRYVRSSEFAAEHNQKPERTIVRLVTDVLPPDASLDFFTRVSYELSKHGLVFEHQVGEFGTPEPVTPVEDIPAAPAASKPASTGAAPAPPTPEPPPLEPELPASEPDLHELAPAVSGFEPDDTTEEVEFEAVDLQPTELTAESGFEDSLPPLNGELGPDTDLVAETAPDMYDPTEPTAGDLESLLDVEGATAEPVDAPMAAGGGKLVGAGKGKEDLPYPPYFPEEEFGRALTGVEEMDYLEADAHTAVIETASGQRIKLEVDPDDPALSGVGAERPSLPRAIGSAAVAAIAGAAVWGLLAVPAGQGAHPLAVAIGFMVGFSVRLRGNGHTMPFRVVAVLFTLFGSALGAVLAAAALTAFDPALGLGGIGGLPTVFSDPNMMVTALRDNFGALSLVSLAIALYLAFRLSTTARSE
jgi:hypothetical protein